MRLPEQLSPRQRELLEAFVRAGGETPRRSDLMSPDSTWSDYCSLAAARLSGMSVGRVRRPLRVGLTRAPLADERGAPMLGELELLRRSTSG